jgi:hypothetical protein
MILVLVAKVSFLVLKNGFLRTMSWVYKVLDFLATSKSLNPISRCSIENIFKKVPAQLGWVTYS